MEPLTGKRRCPLPVCALMRYKAAGVLLDNGPCWGGGVRGLSACQVFSHELVIVVVPTRAQHIGVRGGGEAGWGGSHRRAVVQRFPATSVEQSLVWRLHGCLACSFLPPPPPDVGGSSGSSRSLPPVSAATPELWTSSAVFSLLQLKPFLAHSLTACKYLMSACV